MTRAQWLLERQSGVGSSDAPSLIGVGFNSPAHVYREKVDPVSDYTPDTGVLARGVALEPLVADLYARRMGEPLTRTGAIDRHPDRPWQLASIDAKRADRRPVECKTCVGFGDQWGEQGSADVPEGYAVQVQHQMGVVGADWCDLAALDVISWQLRVYRIPFDPAFFAWLTDVESRFMSEHVIPRRCPGPEWDEFIGVENARRPITPGKVLELGDDAVSLIERRRELLDVKKVCETAVDSINGRLRAMLGDAEIAIAGGYRVKRIAIAGGHVSYTREPSERLDVRAISKRGKS